MEKLKSIVAKILDIDGKKINENTSPENTELWDSFNHLLIISEIEKEFDIIINLDKISEIKNFGDLIKIINK